MPADTDDSPEFRENWQREVVARAREHWTEARLGELARGKALLLPPVEAAPLLRTIGLLHRDASMPPTQVRKYWQVSHMVTLLGSALRTLLTEHAVVRILDAGCGRSYLSLALAWVAEHRWGGQVQILGVDRNAEVIDECRRRARFSRLDHALRFFASPLGELDLEAAWLQAFPEAPSRSASSSTPDSSVELSAPALRLQALISLHACDTATCDALALAVRLGAPLIAVAPCCQAELARGWSALAEAASVEAAGDQADGRAPSPFAAVWSMPHLRRETAADLTDAMRAVLLRACGYQVNAIEFVPSQHTRKNTLIKATASPAAASGDARARALAEYRALVAATGGVGLGLADALPLPADRP